MHCWFKSFDVETLLKERLTSGEWNRFTGAEPKDKLASIIEMIEKAKRQT
jgi:hypothetical protein